jgi:hypothetical protein
MKKFLFTLFTTFIALGINVTAFAQSQKEITNYSMAITVGSNGKTVSLKQSVEIDTGNNKVSIYTAMVNETTKHNDVTDTSIIQAASLVPIYHSSDNSDRKYVLRYGRNGVTGYYIEKETQKQTAIKDMVNVPVIDGASLDYMFMKIPLTTGLKKNFNVYNYNPGSRSNISKVSIDDVENDTYVSKHFGNRNVWKIALTVILPNGERRGYLYYIDKETRRIWKYTIAVGGQNLFSAVNNEDDYNPYHNNFDKEATLKLLTDGKSVISGQAFARDDHGSKISVLNLNKKQVASMGTTVVLIPYTTFFKEWFEQNQKAGKTGKSAPLPKSAEECIKTTQVSDKEGHFEFTNLMPGDYLLIAQFNIHKGSSQTDVTGYTDTYIDGAYQGTNTNTVTHYFEVLAQATAKKVVAVKQDGENVSVNLKQIHQ